MYILCFLKTHQVRYLEFYHQDKDGWLDWCRENEAEIKKEYLRRFDAKESVQDFFGDWCSYNGYSDVGYYLGCRFIEYLMKSNSLKEIANFVSYKLSTLENIFSVATHFILKKYKDHGTIINKKNKDEREIITP